MPVRNEVAKIIGRSVVGLFIFTLAVSVLAAEKSEDVSALQLLSVPLSKTGIEVHENLNARDVARRRPEQPRLGGFADLPRGRLPRSDEIESWESAYKDQQISGIALLLCNVCSAPQSNADFLTLWLDSTDKQRSFLSYLSESADVADTIAEAAAAENIHVKHLTGADVMFAAELFATAGQRLGLDTRAARSAKLELAEIEFLGKRLRRNSDSIFRETNRLWRKGVAQNEPANFIKESLGDEFTQSTIREVIVPGGVALGETARITPEMTALEFDGNRLLVVDAQEKQWALPEHKLVTVKALFEFVLRSQQLRSDAIVDIDGDGKVRISSPLRDTDPGWQIMEADTQPFKFVRNLDVTKSVIIDTFVSWEAVDSENLGFESEVEVRFLSADNMRIAQTRAALVYSYKSITSATDFKGTWGREERRLKENLDTDGLGSSLVKVADYSGWVALFRKVVEDEDVDFLTGRYQFMKIDTTGRKTPARF